MEYEQRCTESAHFEKFFGNRMESRYHPTY